MEERGKKERVTTPPGFPLSLRRRHRAVENVNGFVLPIQAHVFLQHLAETGERLVRELLN